ncbi:hypothetical protein [Chenggangzhangella methanolivorans]|uniref:Uncharacterized protein n=1 Tax=Chenggangzhangella methanolivorans TaxID=1437009 RepID=A0A9E6R951_9HYPH|nr:hypothetical protein [Chenggangzhangella methanolivorans]QZN99594.1 hypothetical protein K6K41_23320 [Chenggangzhangella methanolivorans]
MFSNLIGGRAVRASLVALTIAAVAAPSAAEAGRRTRTAVGVGVAAGVMGLAIGAAAANAQDREVGYEDEAREPRCWTERQEVEDEYGDIHLRRVRVCD